MGLDRPPLRAHAGPALLAAARHGARADDDAERRPAPLGAVRGVGGRGRARRLPRRLGGRGALARARPGDATPCGSRRCAAHGAWGGANPLAGAARRRGAAADGAGARVLTRATHPPARACARSTARSSRRRASCSRRAGAARLGRRRASGRSRARRRSRCGARRPTRRPTPTGAGRTARSSGARGRSAGTRRSCSPASARMVPTGTLGRQRIRWRAGTREIAHGTVRRHRPRRNQDPGGGRRTSSTRCSAPSRHPTPTTGGPADVALAMVAAVREASDAGRRRPRRPHRRRRRARRASSTSRGHRHERAQPARLGGLVPAGGEARGRAGRARSRSATTSTSPRRPSSSSARRSRSARCSACSGAPASAAGSCSTASSGRAAARAGEIGHVVVKSDGRPCPCGRTAAWRPTRAAARWRAAPARRSTEGEKTVLFEIMEEKGKPRLSSRHLGARAGARRQARHHLIDAGGRGARRRASRPRSTCSTSRRSSIGGGLGLRLGEPYVERSARR